MPGDREMDLETALIEGVERQGRAFHALVAQALEEHNLAMPLFKSSAYAGHYIEVDHPTQGQQVELSLAFFLTDPLFGDDGPHLRLEIRMQNAQGHEEDRLSLTVYGDGSKQELSWPTGHGPHPLLFAFRTACEVTLREGHDVHVMNDEALATRYGEWMVRHFFSL